METMMKTYSVNELTTEELNNINGGGPWAIFGGILLVYSFINTVAYAAGYAAGSIVANLD